MSGALLLTAGIGWLVAAAAGAGARKRGFLCASAVLCAVAAAACTAGGVLLAVGGHSTGSVVGGNDLVGQLRLQARPLAAAFLVLLGIVSLAIGCYVPRYHQPETGTAAYLCCLNLAFVASLAVLAAGDVTTFLVAWETMTLTCGLVVLRHRRRSGVDTGTVQFLALSELGFAMIVAAFVILAVHTGSMNFTTMAARASSVPAGWRDAAYLLALVGFGFKAGLVPLHVWLPAAHPVAPADGSAFLSGVVIKLGVYGIVVFAFVLLRTGPDWWGLVTMAVGAASAVLGILYAVMERDMKRFLAYSSVENVGIIMTALGAAMTFRSFHQAALGAFLLLVALYHVVNHGVSKTLLFLETGVVEHAAGTRDLDQLGGLVHRLRASTVISLVGVLSLAALPPLNGFVSEWLTFQGLFQGFRVHDHAVATLIMLAAASLGLTSGLAMLAFARFFGIAFLGMPRSSGAIKADERGQPTLGPGILAGACVALSVGVPAVLVALDREVHAVTGLQLRPVLLGPHLSLLPAHANFSSLSPTYLAVFLVAVSIVPITIYRLGRPRGETLAVPVWDGGILTFKPRLQYTASTFANPIRVTFERLYNPEIELDRASEDPAGRSGPVHYHRRVRPLFERYLYEPVVHAARAVSRAVQRTQSGDINLYLLYILIVFVIAYAVHAL